MKCIAILFFVVMVKSDEAQDGDVPKAIPKCPDIKPANNTNFINICKGRWFVLKLYSVTPSESLNSCVTVDLLTSTENPNKCLFNNTRKLRGNTNSLTTNITMETPGVLDFNDDLYFSTPSGEVSSFRSFVKDVAVYMDDDCIILITCSVHPVQTGKFMKYASISCRHSTLKSEFSEKADKIVAKFDIEGKTYDVLHEDCKY